MLATMASSTSANRIKRRLSELGIHSSVIQTPQSLAKEGCGYSLRFEEHAKKIIQLTAGELGIKIRSFYTENSSEGKATYIKV